MNGRVDGAVCRGFPECIGEIVVLVRVRGVAPIASPARLAS
jgi:hypothetical protein